MTFTDVLRGRQKVPKSDFRSHFSMSKSVRIFPNFFFWLKNIKWGHQLLLNTFFDKFNFKENLFLKLGHKIVNFLNLSTLFKKLQTFLRSNFCDSTSISSIVISFHQILLTWWNAYIWSQMIDNNELCLIMTHCVK